MWCFQRQSPSSKGEQDEWQTTTLFGEFWDLPCRPTSYKEIFQT